jgi:hypothetical protein
MPVMSRIKPRAASVLRSKTELHIANEQTSRSALSRERREVFLIKQLCACKDDAGRRVSEPRLGAHTKEARQLG